MVAVYVIVAVLALLLLLLFLPICLSLRYQENFSFSVRFAGILIPIKPQKEKSEQPKTEEVTPKQEKPKKKNFIAEYTKENGIAQTVAVICRFLQSAIEKSLWFFQKLKIRNLNFSLSVATKNAADTAVLYGSVCAVVYPFFSLVFEHLNCKSDHIDVSADFDNEQSKFLFSTDVKANLFLLLITALSVFRYYRKFQHELKGEVNKNE